MEFLRALRRERKLSTYKAAAGIGIAQSTYSGVECGRRKPSVKLAKKIAAFYGIEWTRFFEDEAAEL